MKDSLRTEYECSQKSKRLGPSVLGWVFFAFEFIILCYSLIASTLLRLTGCSGVSAGGGFQGGAKRSSHIFPKLQVPGQVVFSLEVYWAVGPPL